MNITLRQCYESQQALQVLSAISFKSVLAWRIGKVKARVDAEVKTAETVRVAKIESYQTPAEPGGFRVPEEELVAFQAEMNELLDTEIEIKVEKIKIEELGEKEISPIVFQQCAWMFEDGATESTEKAEGAKA